MSLCIDITSTPSFPESNEATYKTIEVEENSSPTGTLKMTVPLSETLPVTISKLKINGLPQNMIALYFLPSGEAFNPDTNSVTVSPGNDGPSISLAGTLSDVYPNGKTFKVTVSFDVVCGSSQVSNVELNWFEIKTKKTTSTTLLVVLIVIVLIVIVLIVGSVLLAFYFKNKSLMDTKRVSSSFSTSLTLPPPVLNKAPLYYKFI